MLSLYFNCKLTNNSIAHSKSVAGYHFPTMYPKRMGSNLNGQYDILVATIKSYSVFNFDTAIFNLDIEIINRDRITELKRIIENNCSAKELHINFTRPSKVEDWLSDVRKSKLLIKKNCPVLVVMNHDHPFIDYTQNIFNDLVDRVFPFSEDNYGKALYYSHAPEVISWALNGRHNLRFKKLYDGVYKSDLMDNWIDSICIMTMETLEHIWSRAEFKGSYIGRYDWVNVNYSQLGITFYVFPREFFKHFDGYGHITGIRLISEFNSCESTVLQFPNDQNKNELVKFYYQRWLDSFIIMIRDKFMLRDELSTSVKISFINSIEEALNIFKNSYLKTDVDYGLLREELLEEVEAELRSHIYYMGNFIYDAIKNDCDLISEIKYEDKLYKLRKYTPNPIKKLLKIIYNKTRNIYHRSNDKSKI